MKCIVLIITSAFLVVTSEGQWSIVNTGVQTNLASVRFTSENDGWIVGADGLVLRSTNRGLDWTAETLAEKRHLRSIDFTDTLNGWIVGDHGVILRRAWVPGTVGVRWHVVPSGTIDDLRAVDFFDPDHGWACGGRGVVLKTNDGGRTWRNIHSAKNDWETYFGLHFTDSLNGWVVGSNVLHTTDGGESWDTVEIGSVEEMRGVEFVSKEIGWTVGRLGVIRKTLNGGLTWSGQWSTTGVMLTSVSFVDEANGYAVGGGVYGDSWIDSGRVVRTSDGGVTWIQEEQPTGWWMMGSSHSPLGQPWAVGNKGTLTRRDAVLGVSTFIKSERPLGKGKYYDLLGREVDKHSSGLKFYIEVTDSDVRATLVTHDVTR